MKAKYQINIWHFLFNWVSSSISVYDKSSGRVGAPLTCNEVMLVNWEEGLFFLLLYHHMQWDHQLLIFSIHMPLFM